MSRLIKILLIMIFSVNFCTVSHAAIQGNVEYQIPIDYSKLSQEELENKADFYYKLCLKNVNNKSSEDLTSALNLYTMLQRKCPENSFYSIRLGNLYDISGKDRLAKSYFYAALGVDNSNPEAYFSFGEFYYYRCFYKKALKYYNEAYKNGYEEHYDTLYKIGDIYAKFGDTRSALKYLNMAYEKNPNAELAKKIQNTSNINFINKEYYSNTRIH